MESHHLRGHGQWDAADGIHDQEFFFNTKGTHLLSVGHEINSWRHAPNPMPSSVRRIGPTHLQPGQVTKVNGLITISTGELEAAHPVRITGIGQPDTLIATEPLNKVHSRAEVRN